MHIHTNLPHYTEEMEQCDDDIEEEQSSQDSDYEELLSDNED